jgi:hypothetical protein
MEVAGARRPGVQCEEARRAHGAGAGARHVGTGNAHRGGAGEDRGGGGRGDSTRGGSGPPRRCRSGPRTALRCAAVGDWTMVSSAEVRGRHQFRRGYPLGQGGGDGSSVWCAQFCPQRQPWRRRRRWPWLRVCGGQVDRMDPNFFCRHGTAARGGWGRWGAGVDVHELHDDDEVGGGRRARGGERPWWRRTRAKKSGGARASSDNGESAGNRLALAMRIWWAPHVMLLILPMRDR